MTASSRGLRQLLTDWQRAGVTHVRHVERPAAPPVAAARSSEHEPPDRAAPRAPSPSGRPETSIQHTLPADCSLLQAESTASVGGRTEQLAAAAEVVARCVRCQELARSRTQTVFGVGNPQARVMFIGEAPGADEDAQGEPFVGKAGQLLNRIIAACGWKREDLYICNILKCRPPGNRNPTTQEAANCREHLDAQIRIVDPEYIVCWGSVAAQNLLDDTTPIGKLRSRWFQYGRAKVLCTYHPSYLLRNPAAKKPVWEDMKFLLADMGLTPPAG